MRDCKQGRCKPEISETAPVLVLTYREVEMSNDSLHHTVDHLKEKAYAYRAKAEHSIHELPSMQEMESEATGRTASALRVAERAPDAAYLGVMAASMVLSLLFLVRENKMMALFVGLWPVTILNLAMMLKNRRPSREFQQVTPVSAGADGLLLAE